MDKILGTWNLEPGTRAKRAPPALTPQSLCVSFCLYENPF